MRVHLLVGSSTTSVPSRACRLTQKRYWNGSINTICNIMCIRSRQLNLWWQSCMLPRPKVRMHPKCGGGWVQRSTRTRIGTHMRGGGTTQHMHTYWHIHACTYAQILSVNQQQSCTHGCACTQHTQYTTTHPTHNTLPHTTHTVHYPTPLTPSPFPHRPPRCNFQWGSSIPCRSWPTHNRPV